MAKNILQILIKNKYFIIFSIVLSIITWIYWVLTASTENYIWRNVEDIFEIAINKSCKKIFWLNFSFWIISINLILLSIYKLFKKNYTIASILIFINIMSFLSLYQIVKENSAKEYYTIFINQSVAEPFITSPLLKAGFKVGKYVLTNIKNKNSKYRRYAISALGKLNYYPATSVLKKILFDKTEKYYIRANAFESLKNINTQETKEILDKFHEYLKRSTETKLKNYIKI